MVAFSTRSRNTLETGSGTWKDLREPGRDPGFFLGWRQVRAIPEGGLPKATPFQVPCGSPKMLDFSCSFLWRSTICLEAFECPFTPCGGHETRAS